MQGVSRLPNSTLYVVEPGYLGEFLTHNMTNTLGEMLCNITSAFSVIQHLKFTLEKAGFLKQEECMISPLKFLINLAARFTSPM